MFLVVMSHISFKEIRSYKFVIVIQPTICNFRLFTRAVLCTRAFSKPTLSVVHYQNNLKTTSTTTIKYESIWISYWGETISVADRRATGRTGQREKSMSLKNKFLETRSIAKCRSLWSISFTSVSLCALRHYYYYIFICKRKRKYTCQALNISRSPQSRYVVSWAVGYVVFV